MGNKPVKEELAESPTDELLPKHRMGVKKVTLVLDNTSVLAGGFLFGKVCLDGTKKSLSKITEIKVFISGTCDVTFTCSTGTICTKHSKVFKKEITLLEKGDKILGSGGADHEPSSPKDGESSSVPFEIRLPETLPGSFEGRLGKLRYFATATVKEHGRIPNTKDKVKFDVLEQILGPLFKLKPIQVSVSKKVGKGQITFRGRMEKTLYTSGDVISFEGEVHNDTLLSISCKCELLQKISYNIDNVVNAATSLLASSNDLNMFIKQQEIRSITGSLAIPIDISNTVTRSERIEVAYFVLFTFVPCRAVTLTKRISIPILIRRAQDI